MSAQPAPAPTPAAGAYIDVLDGIIRHGARLVRDLCDKPARPGQHVALDYHLITRSVRRSILLVRKLAEKPESGPASENAQARAQNRIAARKRIIREVQDAIQQRARGPSAENLEAELLERLDSPDLDDDIDSRPLPDIIADICRDFGAVSSMDARRWRRRTPENIQALCALAAKPPTDPSAAKIPQNPRRPAPNDDLPNDELPDDPAVAVAAILRYEALARDQR